jgi:hypothetical protein
MPARDGWGTLTLGKSAPFAEGAQTAAPRTTKMKTRTNAKNKNKDKDETKAKIRTLREKRSELIA